MLGGHLKSLIMNERQEPLASLSFSLVALSCQGAGAEEVADWEPEAGQVRMMEKESHAVIKGVVQAPIILVGYGIQVM